VQLSPDGKISLEKIKMPEAITCVDFDKDATQARPEEILFDSNLDKRNASVDLSGKFFEYLQSAM
jgi:hypothetical protein